MNNALAVMPVDIPTPKKMPGKPIAKKKAAPGGKRPVEDTENRGEVRDLRIEFTENGFNTCASFYPEDSPNPDKGVPYPENEELSFGSGDSPSQADVDATLAYVKKLLMEHCDEEASEANGGKKKGSGEGVAAGADAEEEQEAE